MVGRIRRRSIVSSPLTRRAGVLLLGAALLGCSQQASLPISGTGGGFHLEAEEGSIEPDVTAQVSGQAVSDPISGGRGISDPAASGGRAVALWGTNDAVNFTVPASLPAGRYTVRFRGRGEAYQGWPTVALLDRHWRRLATATLDTATYDLRTFGEFEVQPGQTLVFRFLNDHYEGPGRDRNAVVDYLVIEPVASQTTGYAVQFGTEHWDRGQDIAVDASDNAYVAGTAEGTFPGQTRTGFNDVFVRKVNAQGQEVWTRQFGGEGEEAVGGIAVDAAGNSYVAGFTSWGLSGQTSQGGFDAFVRKYTANGTEVWTRQFGTTAREELKDVSLDAVGNVYVVGVTSGSLPGQTNLGGYDGFVRKYTANGTEVWTRQFGTGDFDVAWAVDVDAEGHVFVAGNTSGVLPGAAVEGGSGVFVSKFTAFGEVIWTRQFGSHTPDGSALDPTYSYPSGLPMLDDSVNDLEVDAAGNVFVAGRINFDRALPGQTSAGGGLDAYVRKYSRDGVALWTRQPGTPGNDVGSLALDSAGNVFLARTFNVVPLAAETSVLKYTPDGTLLQTLDLGGPGNVGAVSVGKTGNIFLTGFTLQPLPGYVQRGKLDAFVTKRIP
ncbi:SBBP repeat-containing protein [Deinococcus sp. YIM 134068]|uniref:SBBP repeat-containing protein n=1 Tax=Deinococcus lichenicola TaxID=3118910 RepID=UPI002F93DD1B